MANGRGRIHRMWRKSRELIAKLPKLGALLRRLVGAGLHIVWIEVTFRLLALWRANAGCVVSAGVVLLVIRAEVPTDARAPLFAIAAAMMHSLSLVPGGKASPLARHDVQLTQLLTVAALLTSATYWLLSATEGDEALNPRLRLLGTGALLATYGILAIAGLRQIRQLRQAAARLRHQAGPNPCHDDGGREDQ